MIENGKIYKYTNLLNGMVYIGQTKQSLKDRDSKHLQQIKDNTYFHRALKKYGRENFNLELVEDKIPFDLLDSREKYWIDYFNSFYTTGKGYNLTQGGKWGSGTQLLTVSQVEEIKNILLTSEKTFQEIANDFNVSIYCISDINRGKSFFCGNINYPLRPSPKRSEINENKLYIILDLLSNTNTSYKEIAEAVNINEYTVGQINNGKNSWCPKDIDYPIRKPIKSNTYQNLLSKEDVINICYDLCFSNINQIDIGKKYNVAKNTIGDISRGVSWKEITNQFVCPIRKNKLKNQEIYQSIYGIV